MQHKDQIWPREAEGPLGCRDIQSKDKREVCSTLHPRLWHGHGYVDGHLQCSSDWHSQWDPRQIPPGQKALGHNWHPWPVWRTKKAQEQQKNKDRDGMAQYRAVNQEIKKGMKKAKENWIGERAKILMTAWRIIIAKRHISWFKTWPAQSQREPQPYKTKVEHV